MSVTEGANLSSDDCPYRGLQPYTEKDRPYFFGRERDQQIIASNLYAAPLTILYGASGVGKSSVLLAGVVPQLDATPRLVSIVFRDWQSPDSLYTLKNSISKLVHQRASHGAEVDPTLPLDEFLFECTRIVRAPIFLILDQFEEYFLYHSPSGSDAGFDAEFARAVNRSEVNAHFLLSIREDGLSKLDRFQGRIPHLLSNMLRLDHLNRAAATDAIRKPLIEYNRRLTSGHLSMSIKDDLVEALLEQVETGRVILDSTGQVETSTDTGEEPGKGTIETPFLQMVLTRLWEEETTARSGQLRLRTLQALGGAAKIVRTYLDTVMAEALSDSERETAARAFYHLVTPSGTKIAYTLPDLVANARLPEEQLHRVLNQLSRARILRVVPPPLGQRAALRYEIFHDVLAPAIVDWRTRFVQLQDKAEAERTAREHERRAEEQSRIARRLRLLVAALALLSLLAVVFAVYAVAQRRTALAALGAASIAQGEAEAQRGEAEKQKGEAEKRRVEALKQREEAVKQRGEAEKRRVEALRQREEALTQRSEAEKQKGEAEKRRVEAQTQRGEAEKQKKHAEREEKKAKNQQLRAELALRRVEALQKERDALARKLQPTTSALRNQPSVTATQQLDTKTYAPNTPSRGGVAHRGKTWQPGDTLRIRFLDGDEPLQKKVEECARQWMNYANLTFDFVSTPDAQIRITFKSQGNWSYLGTDALTIPRDRPTMSLSLFASRPTSEEACGWVLREFGLAIGLLNAHQSPSARIPWNKEAVYRFYTGAPYYWDRATVDRNFFQKYDPRQVIFGAFDPHSIMMLPIPKELTMNGFEAGRNRVLSEGDKEFVSRLYPR